MTARQQLVQWVEGSSGFDVAKVDKALEAIGSFTDERCATFMAASVESRLRLLNAVIAEGVFWAAPCYAPPLHPDDYGNTCTASHLRQAAHKSFCTG
jgi:hypothetical protein